MATIGKYLSAGFWKTPVASAADLPTDAKEGEARVTLDTSEIYIFDGTNWVVSPASPIGSTLTSGSVLVGVAGVADDVDTVSQGDVLASATGLTVKTGLDATKIADGSVTNTEFQYINSVTSNVQTQLNSKEAKHTYRLNVGAGGDYATIALANAAAGSLTLSVAQRCLIVILPGTYVEDVTGVNFVDYWGSGFANTIIVGKLDLCLTDSHVSNLGISFTPSADGQIGFCLGTGFGQDVFVYVTANANWSFTGIKATGATGPSGMINCAAFITDTGASSKNYAGIELDGAAFVGALNCAVEINSTSSSSGTQTGLLLTNAGELAVSNTRVYVSHDAGFTGTVRLQSVIGNPIPCQVVNPFFKAEGAGSGTCVAFHCDSSGASARVNVNYPSVDATNYGTYYGADTAATDEQNIRQFASNQSAGITGAGSLLATPYDDKKSGFVAWADSGTYWSRVTNQFTILRGGKGYVRGTTCRFAGGQTVTLTDGVTNFIYAKADGTIDVTATKNAALFEDNQVLFAVYYEADSDDAIVSKENHPYDFDTSVSNYAHDILGSLIGKTGADIGVLSDTGLTIKLTGDSVLSDHGLNTTIPDSSATALTIQYWYRDATDGYKWKLHAEQNTVPLVYNDGSGVPVALTGGSTDHIAHRLYVCKDNLNSSAPIYIAVINEAAYGNQGATNTAIANGSITTISGALQDLEPAQLGYIKVETDGTDTVWGVQIEKSQIGTTISVSGSTATTAGAVGTDTATFDNLLSGSQTSSQSAFDILDNLDPDSNRAISIGGTNATDVNIGRTGQTAKVLGALTVAQGAVVTGDIATAATTAFVRLGPDAQNSWRIGIVSNELVLQKKINATDWETQATVGVS